MAKFEKVIWCMRTAQDDFDDDEDEGYCDPPRDP